MRRAATALVLVLAAGCSSTIVELATLPPHHPDVGPHYQLTLHCSLPVVIGDGYWEIDMQGQEWPPPVDYGEDQLGADVTEPYPVPGAVWLTSESTAIWKADVNGAEFKLTLDPNRHSTAAC